MNLLKYGPQTSRDEQYASEEAAIEQSALTNDITLNSFPLLSHTDDAIYQHLNSLFGQL